MNLINRFVTEDNGAETVEYALVVGLIALAAVAAITATGTNITALFTAINATLTGAL